MLAKIDIADYRCALGRGLCAYGCNLLANNGACLGERCAILNFEEYLNAMLSAYAVNEWRYGTQDASSKASAQSISEEGCNLNESLYIVVAQGNSQQPYIGRIGVSLTLGKHRVQPRLVVVDEGVDSVLRVGTLDNHLALLLAPTATPRHLQK